MCKVTVKPEASAQSLSVVGRECPACHNRGSKLDNMRFLDPHGMQRVDDDIFECSAHRHTFVLDAAGLRLIASDGQRERERRTFALV